MNIPPKYEDVVVKLEAALGREAALREDLASANSDKEAYAKNVIGLQAQRRKLREELQDRKRKHLRICQISIGKSQLTKDLQQRLTVAEQRAGDLEHSLMWVRSQLTDARVIFHIDAMLKPATERPVMHPGKPPTGSVVTVHGSIKAIVIAHHAEGIIAGAGEGHLVKDGSYKP